MTLKNVVPEKSCFCRRRKKMRQMRENSPTRKVNFVAKIFIKQMKTNLIIFSTFICRFFINIV